MMDWPRIVKTGCVAFCCSTGFLFAVVALWSRLLAARRADDQSDRWLKEKGSSDNQQDL